MGPMDILRQYTGTKTIASAESAHDHFDAIARTTPPDILGPSVADAFRAESTPPFGEMVGQMYRESDPQQQAGVLNQLLGSIGPGFLSALGTGYLGKQPAAAPITSSQIAPQQASQVTAAQVHEIATQAEQDDPGVLDKIGGFYADHPQLVKTLGSAALAIALAGVARRMRT